LKIVCISFGSYHAATFASLQVLLFLTGLFYRKISSCNIAVLEDKIITLFNNLIAVYDEIKPAVSL
jgi:hypothetical protein